MDVLLLQDLVGNVRNDIINGSYINNQNNNTKFKPNSDHFGDYILFSPTTESGILYRHDLQITEIPAIKPITQNRNQNTVLSGILIHTKKDNIGVYSAYRPNGKSDPTQLFEYKLQGERIIIGGDFNLHHELWGSITHNKYSVEFINYLANSEYELCNSKEATFKNSTTNKESHIDLTIKSNNIEIKNWHVLNHNYPKLFDHYLILFEIHLTPENGYNLRRKTWNINSNNWYKFTHAMNLSINKLSQYINHCSKICAKNPLNKQLHRTEINRINTDITNTTINNANSTIGQKHFYVGYNPWWNKKCETKKQQRKRIHRRRSRIKKKYYKSEYLQSIYPTLNDFPEWNEIIIKCRAIRNKRTCVIRKSKRIKSRDINYTVQNPHLHTKKLWKTINHQQFKQDNHIPPIFINKNTTIQTTNDNQKATLIHNVTKHPPQPEFKQKHINHHVNIETEINEILTGYESIESEPDTNPDNILNSKIYLYEIINCISELNTQKAIGEDQIHNVMLKKLSITFIENIILPFFNLCFKYHIFPDLWNKANILPIPKPEKDHRYATNYRPIAISSCFGKLYERILAKRLQAFCAYYKIFNNYQCGFQINKQCQDMLNIFLTDAYKCMDIKTDMDCIFTDFSKAYDTIWHKGLYWKLHTLYARGNIFSIK